MYAVIILFRFFLGIGLGGIFPLSATKASEDSCSESNENKVNSVGASWAFFWQMPGFVVGLYLITEFGISLAIVFCKGPLVYCLFNDIQRNFDGFIQMAFCLGFGMCSVDLFGCNIVLRGNTKEESAERFLILDLYIRFHV